MIRPTGAPLPYAYQVPPAPATWTPPVAVAYQSNGLHPQGEGYPAAYPAGYPAAGPPGYAAYPPAYPQPYRNQADPGREGKAFRELTAGAALHGAVAASVCGLIGFFIGGPVGAAWGAGIGTGLAAGFMQMLAKMADGGGAHASVYAAGPAVVTGVAAWAAGAAWGAGAAAWSMVLVPAAIAACVVAWGQLNK